MEHWWLLPVLIFAAALLYSSVGHAGASGYIAAMAFAGVAPDAMKPVALILNICVGTIATIRYYHAGCFSSRVFIPLVIGSIPFAFIGGSLSIPDVLYKQIVGLVLLVAAFRLAFPSKAKSEQRQARIPFLSAIVCGAVIGFLAGLTGTGGGIFLSPMLLFLGWTETKETSGVSVAFILVNSLAGIAGHGLNWTSLPAVLPFWILAAVFGGILGAELGSKYLGNLTLKRLLAVVLVIAGCKLILV